MTFNEKTMELEGKINVPNYNGIKNKAKFIDWICSEEILVEEHFLTKEEKEELIEQKLHLESKQIC